MKNNDIKILQFLAVQKPDVMFRFINRLAVQAAVIVLDLEDALWDVIQPERTAELKAKGRKELVAFAQNYPGIFLQRQIGIRLNKNTGPEFSHDITALAQIADIVKFEAVVLTKIETPRDIIDCMSQLSDNRIRYKNLVLIVETKSGIENLDEIVHTAHNKNIEYIVYGHYDYSLETQQWPFLEFTEAGYWEHVIPIIKRIEDGHGNFIHPPFFQIYDDRQFTEIFHRLRTLCKRPFGIITLAEQQARLCSMLAEQMAITEEIPLRNSRIYQHDELVYLAESVRRSFEIKRRSRFSFVFEPKTGRFISPHVYLAAVRYLESDQNGGNIDRI